MRTPAQAAAIWGPLPNPWDMPVGPEAPLRRSPDVNAQMPDEKFLLAQKMRHEPTPSENEMWRLLGRGAGRQGVRFRRQYPLFGYIADFYSPSKKLVIEVDGRIHNPVADAIRDLNLKKRGIATMRFTNDEVWRTLATNLRLTKACSGGYVRAYLKSPPWPDR